MCQTVARLMQQMPGSKNNTMKTILAMLAFLLYQQANGQTENPAQRDTLPVRDSVVRDSMVILDSAVVRDSAMAQHDTIPLRESTMVRDSIASVRDSVAANSDLSIQAVDTNPPARSKYNMYGDLLNDDPVYNRRYAWWKPALRVAFADAFTWGIDRYILNADFSHIGPSTWKTNLREGWEWDTDRFGVNFIGHPYSGTMYFNIARSNGYSYWQSLPYAVEGSLIWEYFGENTRPSYNDIINTPISGAFLGEVLYRLSSNILDESARGASRVWREIIAGIIDPSRALNRFTQGKMFRHTPYQVYQREPLNVTLYAGIHKVNTNNKFGTGATNEIFNIQLDYGNPFEVRYRKPFDMFRLRAELSYGVGRKLLDNVTGYGLLFGRNVRKNLLIGGFQNYDYWDNKIFELGSLGFGFGMIARTPLSRNSNLYSAIHLAVVPLAGNSTRFGPDTSQYRDYNFGGGLEGKVEETFNLNKWFTLGFNFFYYWVHTYEGFPGNSLVGIFKPRITVKLFRNMSVGMEEHIYQNDRFHNGADKLHLTRTEQKFFIQLFLEDDQRHGKYH